MSDGRKELFGNTFRIFRNVFKAGEGIPARIAMMIDCKWNAKPT